MKQGETEMRIAIIGTGNVGSAIARGLKGKGHDVLLGARNPQTAEVAELVSATDATPMFPAAAAAEAEIIVLALPWGGAETAVKALGPLEDKTVIDCMNPLGMVEGALGLTLGHSNSGGEMVQGWIPGAHVVKTLNQVGAEIMAKNDTLPQRPVMFMAGDDAAAKARVAALLTDLGFAAMDAGDITKARLLEPFGMVWINQALFRGKGRNWAFAAVEG
ncbi:NAD(P)-binding domain-containing protein [Thioclava sp. F1Mire-8]|uniref:NADPH-dependent F420 reductase n=1 Tax=Thioclava sp. F1Mire-8 TaxID=1973006 RepID=UPI0011BD00D9|nr:NAD(P)-binding domain-containing protein [Thioclava sp. F1Mire-8]